MAAANEGLAAAKETIEATMAAGSGFAVSVAIAGTSGGGGAA